MVLAVDEGRAHFHVPEDGQSPNPHQSKANQSEDLGLEHFGQDYGGCQTCCFAYEEGCRGPGHSTGTAAQNLSPFEADILFGVSLVAVVAHINIAVSLIWLWSGGFFHHSS